MPPKPPFASVSTQSSLWLQRRSRFYGGMLPIPFPRHQPARSFARETWFLERPRGEDQGRRLLDLLGAGFLIGIGGVKGMGESDPSIDSDEKNEVSAMALSERFGKGSFLGPPNVLR